MVASSPEAAARCPNILFSFFAGRALGGVRGPRAALLLFSHPVLYFQSPGCRLLWKAARPSVRRCAPDPGDRAKQTAQHNRRCSSACVWPVCVGVRSACLDQGDPHSPPASHHNHLGNEKKNTPGHAGATHAEQPRSFKKKTNGGVARGPTVRIGGRRTRRRPQQHLIATHNKNPIQKTKDSFYLSAMDLWVPTTMKNAAKCDMSCELQDQVSHQIFERTLLTPVLVSLGHTWFRLCHHHSPPAPTQRSRVLLGVRPAFHETADRSPERRPVPTEPVRCTHTQ